MKYIKVNMKSSKIHEEYVFTSRTMIAHFVAMWWAEITPFLGLSRETLTRTSCGKFLRVESCFSESFWVLYICFLYFICTTTSYSQRTGFVHFCSGKNPKFILSCSKKMKVRMVWGPRRTKAGM